MDKVRPNDESTWLGHTDDEITGLPIVEHSLLLVIEWE